MKIDGRQTRTIWLEADGWSVGVIDQTQLPHRFVTVRLATVDDAAHAISAMQVRGAPLIGATAAYGVCLALRADASDEALERAYARTGAAVLASGLTAIAGFAVLIASDIQMLRDFGIVTVIDLAAALAGVLVVLPAALIALEDRRATGLAPVEER